MKHLDLTVTRSARRQLQLMLDTSPDAGDIVSVMFGFREEDCAHALDFHVRTANDADCLRTEAAFSDEAQLFYCDEFTLHIMRDVEPFIGRELIYADGEFMFRLH